jgi:membrane-bound lytic murein transglycosylase D
MSRVNFKLILLFFFSLSLFCQVSKESKHADIVNNKKENLSFLDSIKKSFVHHKMSHDIDSLWSKELVSLDVYNELITDIKTINPDTPVDYELPTEVLKKRLQLLDEKSPFNIEYNKGLENIIKSFLKNRKHSFERLMGISQYYFPMFEEALAKYNVPLEIKYLAVVESALNSKAVSRAGATGLWQFMYHTGKQYNLNINSYVDERSDALKSSDAAARYMQKMFTIFNDWDLVLASYNSGPGNVSKAIRRSGGLQNFWNIKKHLPRETQGYVPAFLATMYIFEYHKEHGIKPEKALFNHFYTDTVAVKNKITFKQLSDLLDIPQTEIEFLNPSYKTKVIPYVTNEVHFVRLPKNKVSVFTSNEDKIYAYANHVFNSREKTIVKNKVVVDSTAFANNDKEEQTDQLVTKTSKLVSKTRYHKVISGDNMSDIAEKYNVSIADIKKWNRLRSSTVQLGSNLKIMTSERVVVYNKNIQESKPDATYSLAEKVKSVESKIPVTSEKVIDPKQYVVERGDNLFNIALENKTTVADLKKWNNLPEDGNIKLGDKLIVENPEIQVSEKPVANLNSKNSKTVYYRVKKEDSLFEIAIANNVSMDDLKLWNNLSDDIVKVGERLKILKPLNIASKTAIKSNVEKFKTYTVQKGDSLFIISQKHPGVTIANIKKWNNLKDENIRPGMKLKING